MRRPSQTQKHLRSAALFVFAGGLIIASGWFLCQKGSHGFFEASSTSPSPDGSSSNSITFKQLHDLVLQNRVDSVEKLLPLLPKTYLLNYAMVYDSESLQGADPLHPRILMFGDDAKMVMTFNGDPKAAGFNSLEVVEFNTQTRFFEFHDIKFPAAGAADRTVTFNPPDPNQGNPQLCMSCHEGHNRAGMPDPRPNWSIYPKWDGLYGSTDDYPEGEELENFRKFMDTRMQSPRYSQLLIPEGSKNSPYLDVSKGKFKYRPNLRMTMFLSRWNAKRLARIIESQPNYTIFRDVNLLNKYFSPEQADFYQETRAAGMDADSFYARATKPSDWSMEFYFPDDLSKAMSFFVGDVSEARYVDFELWKDFLKDHPQFKDDLSQVYNTYSLAEAVGGYLDDTRNHPPPPDHVESLKNLIKAELGER